MADRRTVDNRQFCPINLAQLQHIVREATVSGRQVYVFDGNLTPELSSPQPACQIDLSNLSGMVALNKNAATATFLAGTTIAQASAELKKYGLAIVGVQSNSNLTIATALAFGAHGANPREPSFSGSAVAVTLVRADGDLLPVSATNNAHYWGATRLTLGAIGIVAEVTVRVRALYPLVVKRSKIDIYELLAELPQARQKVDFYLARWRPSQLQAQVTLGWYEQYTKDQANTQSAQHPSTESGNKKASGILKRIYSGIKGVFDNVELNSEQIRSSSLTEVSAGRAPSLVDCLRVEYQFPFARITDVVQAIYALADSDSMFNNAHIRMGMVAADDVWLSAAYGQDVVALAFEVPEASSEQLKLLHQAEELFIYFGGLPTWVHWCTFHSAEAADVMSRYSDFVHVAHDLDQHSQFGNAITHRVVA